MKNGSNFGFRITFQLRLKDRIFHFIDKFALAKSRNIRRIDLAVFVILAMSFGLVLYHLFLPKEDSIGFTVDFILRQMPRFLIIALFAKWLLLIFTGKSFKFLERKFLPPLLLAISLVAFEYLKSYYDILNTSFILYLLLTALFVIDFIRIGSELKNNLLNPSFLFVVSFITLILVGTSFLLIPNATNGNLSLIDALFTATSAVCVTGLTTVDTAVTFTDYGKDILLILIQIGGLGLMTFTNFFTILFKGGMTFKNHLLLNDLIQSDKPNSLFSTLSKIVVYTLIVEIIGALFIHWSTVSAGQGWFFSVFHSISAFCNAGFSTISDGLFNSNIKFNYEFQLVICLLVVLGGIGFPVVNDIYGALKSLLKSLLRVLFFKERFTYKARNLNVHSRLVISTTFWLLVFGFIVYFISEYNNTLAEHTTLYGKLVQSVFGSVTPRTAGFNSVNMGGLMQSTILLYLLLMWIGASPSSTGGGIKTTTLAIALANVKAMAKGKEKVDIFKREITNSSIQRAFAVMFLSLLIIGLAVFFISIFEPNHSLSEIAFECFSAYSTVGLSLNLTPTLTAPSKIVLILTMFIGRVGMFTLLIGLFKKETNNTYQYPKENVLIV